MTTAPDRSGITRVRVESADAMRALGEALGRAVSPGDRLLLEGPFGAGKTTLVQGLGRGLGVEAPISSPSFVLENQYSGRLRLYHVDLYRLERLDPGLLEQLEEDLFGDGVSAVEWPGALPPDLAEGATRIRIDVDPAGGRVVEIASPEERLRAAARTVLG